MSTASRVTRASTRWSAIWPNSASAEPKNPRQIGIAGAAQTAGGSAPVAGRATAGRRRCSLLPGQAGRGPLPRGSTVLRVRPGRDRRAARVNRSPRPNPVRGGPTATVDRACGRGPVAAALPRGSTVLSGQARSLPPYRRRGRHQPDRGLHRPLQPSRGSFRRRSRDRRPAPARARRPWAAAAAGATRKISARDRRA
jgi:hypothetical protein